MLYGDLKSIPEFEYEAPIVKKTPHSKQLYRFSIRWMLLLLIPLAVVFAWWGHTYRERVLAIQAYSWMLAKEDVVVKYQVGTDQIVDFTSGDVTDTDLLRFVPAFDPCAELCGIGKIIGIRLNGSDVTKAGLQRFRKQVPECIVEP